MHTCVSRCLWRPEEALECLGAGVIGISEPPDVGTGIRTPVLMPEQQELLTPEPLFQTYHHYFIDTGTKAENKKTACQMFT